MPATCAGWVDPSTSVAVYTALVGIGPDFRFFGKAETKLV
jgi:hypothetical protein